MLQNTIEKMEIQAVVFLISAREAGGASKFLPEVGCCYQGGEGVRHLTSHVASFVQMHCLLRVEPSQLFRLSLPLPCKRLSVTLRLSCEIVPSLHLGPPLQTTRSRPILCCSALANRAQC